MARNVGGGYSGGRRTGGYSRHGSRRSRSAGRGGFAGNPGTKTESAHERDDARDADACREAALRLLDAAPRPSGALAERLRGKGYDADVVERVVARLVEVGLVDDEEYARSAIRYCAGRLLGYRGTFAEMTRKGVERSLARRVCDQARDEGVFEECAWELGRRYAAKTQGLEPEVRKRRFWSAGGRKGHDPAILREVAHDCFD
ncbi:regulatory protein RecX [Bifidobacterium leontopitheci]